MFCAAVQSTDSPTSSLSRPAVGQRQSVTNQEVSAVRQALTDAELESHIKSCTYLMERAYAAYEASSCLSDRGESDRWRILRDEAVKSRGASLVARLEQERGLA